VGSSEKGKKESIRVTKEKKEKKWEDGEWGGRRVEGTGWGGEVDRVGIIFLFLCFCVFVEEGGGRWKG